MSEKELHSPIPHDGWLSRRTVMAMGAWLVGVMVASIALFVSKPGAAEPVADFAQWSTFIQMYTGIILVPTLASLVLDKKDQLEALAAKLDNRE